MIDRLFISNNCKLLVYNKYPPGDISGIDLTLSLKVIKTDKLY